MAELKLPLLTGYEDPHNKNKEQMVLDAAVSPARKSEQSSRQGRWFLSWSILLLFQVSIIVFCMAFYDTERCLRVEETLASSTPPLSPANNAVRYEMRYFEKYSYLNSPFAKPPGAIVNNAWHELLQGMNIRVGEEYLKPHNASSVALADGSGYVAQLGVYHELHCLKKLKHWIYRDHYHPSLTPEEQDEEQAHAEHCLEWLRMAALCRGDTTLTTLAWSQKEPRSLETEYPIPRHCVDPDVLFAWSKDNSVQLSEVARP